jgi:integrase
MAIYTRIQVAKDGPKSEYWYVEIGLPNGKKLKRSVGKNGIVTKNMARQVEHELKRKVKLGQWDMIRDIPTLSEFIPEFVSYLKHIKHNKAWDVAEYCVKNFAKAFGAKELSAIDSADVEDFKRLRTKDGRKPAAINKELSFVKHLFNYVKRCNKFFANNPVSISGLLTVNNIKTRVLMAEEEALLLANARELLLSIIRIALLTGLRLNSIRTLSWASVDLNANTITIESTYSKNKKEPILPISSTIRKLLLEAKLRRGGSEYVFSEAMAMTRSDLGKKFHGLCKKLGIQGLRFHDLRHTCGTRLAEQGHGIETISKVLGHSSVKMSMRYVHPKESVRRALEDLANYEGFATHSTTHEIPEDISN